GRLRFSAKPLFLGGRRGVRVDLARVQVRGAAAGQVGLADLGLDVHAIVRGEGAEVVRALPADPGVLVYEDGRGAGRLVGAAVPVRAKNCEHERRVAVGRVDVRGERALEDDHDLG